MLEHGVESLMLLVAGVLGKNPLTAGVHSDDDFLLVWSGQDSSVDFEIYSMPLFNQGLKRDQVGIKSCKLLGVGKLDFHILPFCAFYYDVQLPLGV